MRQQLEMGEQSCTEEIISLAIAVRPFSIYVAEATSLWWPTDLGFLISSFSLCVVHRATLL